MSNATYDEQGWIRRRDYSWRTDIPKLKANLNLRKNKTVWKGTVKVDGVLLPGAYTTPLNLDQYFVTDSFYQWAHAQAMAYLLDQKENNGTP